MILQRRTCLIHAVPFSILQSKVIEEDNELTTHEQYDLLRAFDNHLSLFAEAVGNRVKGHKHDTNEEVGRGGPKICGAGLVLRVLRKLTSLFPFLFFLSLSPPVASPTPAASRRA